MDRIERLLNFALSSGCRARRDVAMRDYTSFKIGGPAELFVEPADAAQTAALAAFCRDEDIPLFVLGKGSNILVADSGIKGAVLFTGGLCKVSLLSENEIECGSGLSLSKLCSFAMENSLSGLEFAFGIPGTVGGGAYMNAGAYSGEMKDVLLSCSHICGDSTAGELCGDALDLSYRHSAYEENGFIITSARFRLERGDRSAVRARMNDVLSRRKEKQPLEYPSAGSTFKRPEGHYAGALIEQCGLKGTGVGGAQVSSKHAGFIINRGGATADDVRRLVDIVVRTVEERTGVRLTPEIKFVC